MRWGYLPRAFAAAFVGLGLVLAGCGNGVGTECSSDEDCPGDGFCCEQNRCGGGMCTFDCNRDSDCPGGAICSGSICLRSCKGDGGCTPDQTCTRDGGCEFD